MKSMSKLLIRIFIKNKKLSSAQERERYGVLSGAVGIVCNLLLCIFKFAVGSFTNSVSITADAVNNLSDASSNIVTIAGAKLSGKPVDDEHPFGHGRIEYICGLIISFLIFLMSFELLKSSVEKLIHPEAVNFSAASVIILIVAILVKLWMAFFNNIIYKETENVNAKAVKQDCLNDCIATAATIAALLISRFTDFVYADGIMGIIVAVLIFISGVEIVKDISSRLLGRAPSPQLVKRIEDIMLSQSCIYGVHDLIVHDYGPGRIIASAHAEVPCDADILEVHDIIDITEKLISKELNIMMCIHMDPVAVNDEKINRYKEFMAEIIKEYDEKFTFHDFRVVDGRIKTNFIFDLVIPHQYPQSKREIISGLQKAVSEKDKNIFLVITVEHSFV